MARTRSTLDDGDLPRSLVSGLAGVVDAGLHEPFESIVTPSCAYRPRTGALGQLDTGDADTTGHAPDQERLAGLQGDEQLGVTAGARVRHHSLTERDLRHPSPIPSTQAGGQVAAHMTGCARGQGRRCTMSPPPR